MLRRPAALEPLVEAVREADRLVLLGDVVELLLRRRRRAFEVAEPVLRAIGGALDAQAEIVFVPGNHDRPLIARWLRERPLSVSTEVPANASVELAQLTGWLGPQRVRVRYPGVWLREDVWATHGHYLDRHLLPHSTFGVSRTLVGDRPSDRVEAAAYEHGRSAGRAAAGSLPEPLSRITGSLGRRLRKATMPQVERRLWRRELAPLNARLLSVQMRYAAIPALARVTRRLGVQAEWVLFGHVHRLGPLPADDPRQWRPQDDGPRFVNTGSWLWEPRLAGEALPPHPYWPGGAVLIEDGGPPTAIGLLDGVAAREFEPPASRTGSYRRAHAAAVDLHPGADSRVRPRRDRDRDHPARVSPK